MTDHDHPDTSNGPDTEPSHPGEDTDPEVLAVNPEVHPSAIDDLDADDSAEQSDAVGKQHRGN